MTKVVNMHEAKTQLSALVQQALAGEEVIIAKRGQSLVKLVVVADAAPHRRFGTANGLVQSMNADFDAPLEDFGDYMPDESRVAEEPPEH